LRGDLNWRFWEKFKCGEKLNEDFETGFPVSVVNFDFDEEFERLVKMKQLIEG
jgi:hypothetical protein